MGNLGLFPARAGVILTFRDNAIYTASVPRTRGGDPTRVHGLIEHGSLFPARAGVILVIGSGGSGGITVPRTRGGDPKLAFVRKQANGCSPHARG